MSGSDFTESASVNAVRDKKSESAPPCSMQSLRLVKAAVFTMRLCKVAQVLA